MCGLTNGPETSLELKWFAGCQVTCFKMWTIAKAIPSSVSFLKVFFAHLEGGVTSSSLDCQNGKRCIALSDIPIECMLHFNIVYRFLLPEFSPITPASRPIDPSQLHLVIKNSHCPTPTCFCLKPTKYIHPILNGEFAVGLEPVRRTGRPSKKTAVSGYGRVDPSRRLGSEIVKRTGPGRPARFDGCRVCGWSHQQIEVKMSLGFIN
jgi:hypothetical protein